MTKTNKQTQFLDTCDHKGNTVLYTAKGGGRLMIGGWKSGAEYNSNTHVIDLTGTEHSYSKTAVAFDSKSTEFLQYTGGGYAGWLSLPFPDYKIPSNLTTYQQWHGIAQIIKSILDSGTDVLVACYGGHGRSGLFCAIVGYILGINENRAWASPVEHIRKIHCDEAVETYQQEKYVYDILGLKINISRTYEVASRTWHYIPCPICGTQSTYVDDIGMCLGCQRKYANAPEVYGFTPEDYQKQHGPAHACTDEKCIGIVTASACGHTVHNMAVADGMCETCWVHANAEAIVQTGDIVHEDMGACVVCGKTSYYADKYGVCYECAAKLTTEGLIDYVHNSITDPYRAVPHNCPADVWCTGIFIADVCQHVVHGMEIEAGLCEVCRTDREVK